MTGSLLGGNSAKDQYEYRVALIDANDAADAEQELLKWKGTSDQGWALYAMGVGQVQKTGLKIPGEPGHEDPALLSLLVQAKFIDGEIYYNEDEQKVLKEWIKQVGVESVEKMILHILRDQSARRNAYPESSLGTMIKRLKEGKS